MTSKKERVLIPSLSKNDFFPFPLPLPPLVADGPVLALVAIPTLSSFGDRVWKNTSGRGYVAQARTPIRDLESRQGSVLMGGPAAAAVSAHARHC